MKFVDTNIFIRFLTDDIPEKADACEEIFKKAVEKKETLFTTDLVIAKIVWVLESFYGLPKKEVQDKVDGNFTHHQNRRQRKEGRKETCRGEIRQGSEEGQEKREEKEMDP